MKLNWNTWKDRDYVFVIILVFLFLMPVIFFPRIHGNDGIGYFVYLRSMMMDGDFDFTNEFAHYHGEYIVVGTCPVTGKPVNGVPVGSAILWSPFFLAAHGVNLLTGSTYPADGYSYPYVFAVGFGTLCYGLLGLLLCFKILRRFFPREISWMAVMMGWLASPLVFYMYLHPSMAHTNSFFAVTLFFYLFLRIYLDGHNHWQDWLLLGISGGLMAIIRHQDILFNLFLLLLLLPGVNRNLKPLSWLCWGFGFLLIVSPQLMVWKSIFGGFLSGPQSHQIGTNMNIWHSHPFLVLFSGRHGLFTWHPVLLLGLVGWFYWYRKASKLVFITGIILLLQVWVIGSWREWWGAYSFGHRMFTCDLLFFILGIGALLETKGFRRYQTAAMMLGLLLIAWNFGLMYQYAYGLLDRDGTTPFLKVIFNQFTLLSKH